MTTSDDVREARALVVFESMFGNTEQVARAVADGLAAAGVPTRVSEVSETPADLPSSVDLLIVGAPTHAFSLSRPKTRIEAVRQGADQSQVAIGLREWLETAGSHADRPVRVAVFDTRVSRVRRLPAAAGPSAARLAKRRGFARVDRPVAFLVDDVQGPLVEGEAERATSWGRSMAAELSEVSG
jgi:flavorubredoxin